MNNTQSSLTVSTPAARFRYLSNSNSALICFLGLALLTFLASETVAQTTYAFNEQNSFRIPSDSMESASSLERRVFELVNRERVANGLKPLVWIEKAANVARYHSNNMAQSNFLGHRDMAGKRVSDRADKLGLSNWDQIGENVAWNRGYDDPAVRAVIGWMRSPGHRQNIMDRRYSETGLGLSIGSDGKYYFTQVFVSPR